MLGSVVEVLYVGGGAGSEGKACGKMLRSERVGCRREYETNQESEMRPFRCQEQLADASRCIDSHKNKMSKEIRSISDLKRCEWSNMFIPVHKKITISINDVRLAQLGADESHDMGQVVFRTIRSIPDIRGGRPRDRHAKAALTLRTEQI